MKTAVFLQKFGKHKAFDLVYLSNDSGHDFEQVKPFYQNRFRQHILDFITDNYVWNDFINELNQLVDSLLFIECFGGIEFVKKALKHSKKRRNKVLFKYLKQAINDYENVTTRDKEQSQ